MKDRKVIKATFQFKDDLSITCTSECFGELSGITKKLKMERMEVIAHLPELEKRKSRFRPTTGKVRKPVHLFDQEWK